MTAKRKAIDWEEVRARVWKVIRISPMWTFADVVQLTECPQASTYLLTLYKASYIRQAGKRKEANGRKVVVWRLAKNTGPKPPYPCPCLYDPNLHDLAEVAEKAGEKGEKS